MSVGSCSKCWNDPCSCGHLWKSYTKEDLQKLVEILQAIIVTKIKDELYEEHLAQGRRW